MEYRETVVMPSTKNVVCHYVASCIKCNSDDITIKEYEDIFGFISKAKCNTVTCENEVRVNSGVLNVIELWNRENDISTLITDKIALIEKTKFEIKKLKALQRVRQGRRAK